jgi:hypothetical protein
MIIKVVGLLGIANMGGSSKRKVTGEVGVTTDMTIAGEVELGLQSCLGPGGTSVNLGAIDELLLESPSQKARSMPLAHSLTIPLKLRL